MFSTTYPHDILPQMRSTTYPHDMLSTTWGGCRGDRYKKQSKTPHDILPRHGGLSWGTRTMSWEYVVGKYVVENRGGCRGEHWVYRCSDECRCWRCSMSLQNIMSCRCDAKMACRCLRSDMSLWFWKNMSLFFLWYHIVVLGYMSLCKYIVCRCNATYHIVAIKVCMSLLLVKHVVTKRLSCRCNLKNNMSLFMANHVVVTFCMSL